METIEELLNTIQSNELVLPEFQREFEWDRDNSKSLIQSLYNGYPIGSILRWKTEDPPAIKNDAIDRDGGVQIRMKSEAVRFLSVYARKRPPQRQFGRDRLRVC